MIYVFDTNSISNLRFIFQSKFFQFWRDMQHLVNRGKIISTRVVKNELDVKFNEDKNNDENGYQLLKRKAEFGWDFIFYGC